MYAIRICALAAMLVAGLNSASVLAAESWPTRPLRFVFPFPSGSGSEVAARALAQRLSKVWGQQIVIDNRPGASSMIGTDLVAKASPDGHTFGWVIAAHAINPSLYPRMPFDPVRDLRGITLLFQLKIVIVTAPHSPLGSVNDLIAMAKAKPGQVTFTSASVGTGGHLLGELFKLKHGLTMQHIGYKGGTAAHPDVMSGRVTVMFDTLPNALMQTKAGRLKAIAVIGDKPVAALPQVPPLQGLLPERAITGWNGVVVPAATPAAIVARLHADFTKAVLSPEIQEVFATLNVETITTTPAQFDAFIREEIERWGDVVKRAGVKLE